MPSRSLLLIASICIACLALSACLKEPGTLSAGKKPAGKSAELQLLIDCGYQTFGHTYLLPDGGYLVAVSDPAGSGRLRRLDGSGKELWSSPTYGTAKLKVLHVDDAGMIYVASADYELQAFDSDGRELWRLDKVMPRPEPDWLGNASQPKFAIIDEQLVRFDAAGNTVWSQDHSGHSRHLSVWRRPDGHAWLYYIGTDERPDSDAGNVSVETQIIDENGNLLDSLTDYRTDSSDWKHYGGRFRILGNERFFVIRNNLVFELTDDDGIQPFVSLSDSPDYSAIFYGGDMYLTPEGNFLFVTDDPDAQYNRLDMFEYDPQGKLLHAHSMGPVDIGFDVGQTRAAVCWYDMYSRLCYFYVETNLLERSGTVVITNINGDRLAEYNPGKGPVTRFMRRADGAVLAQRFDGSLMLVPPLPKKEQTDENS